MIIILRGRKRVHVPDVIEAPCLLLDWLSKAVGINFDFGPMFASARTFDIRSLFAHRTYGPRVFILAIFFDVVVLYQSIINTY